MNLDVFRDFFFSLLLNDIAYLFECFVFLSELCVLRNPLFMHFLIHNDDVKFSLYFTVQHVLNLIPF